MLSGTGRGRLPTRRAIVRLDRGCVADLQYETRYAGEYRSALNFPVYLLEKLNNEPELEHTRGLALRRRAGANFAPIL